HCRGLMRRKYCSLRFDWFALKKDCTKLQARIISNGHTWVKSKYPIGKHNLLEDHCRGLIRRKYCTLRFDWFPLEKGCTKLQTRIISNGHTWVKSKYPIGKHNLLEDHCRGLIRRKYCTLRFDWFPLEKHCTKLQARIIWNGSNRNIQSESTIFLRIIVGV